MKPQTPDMEAAKLLERVAPLPVPQFVLDDRFYDTLAEASPHDQNALRPSPSWTFAKKKPTGTKLPQTIAHRGYKAHYPENTMGAFRGAAEVGTHAIETDVHLTKDDVVVLSHDANLKRCFGKEDKIIDCDWDYINQLETLKTPKQPMPRLQDLLEFLALPDTNENIWLLLDIKLDNDASDVIRLVAKTINSVAPHSKRPWQQRIVLGCWAAKFLPLCAQHLPDFSITHISFSTTYARQFLRVPNVSFNMLQHTLLVPYFGSSFLKDAKRNGRPVYTWTVNEEDKMRWCIREGLDGVCTDDPKRFLEVCDEWEQGHRTIKIATKQWLLTAWIQIMICLFSAIFWCKHGGMDRSHEAVQPRKEVTEKPRTRDQKLQKTPIS